MKELRYIPMDDAQEVRSDGDDGEKKAVGMGIVYDTWTELFPGYKERIMPGAVKRDKIVKSFFNHDPSMVLSTTKSKPPLELNDTDKGLEFISPIPPTSYGNDLMINLERGNVKGASFAFSVPDDGQKRWEEDGVYYREIRKLTLYEIGPVTDPAYMSTSANLRSAEDVHKEFLAAKAQESAEARAAEEAAEEERQKQELAAKNQREFNMRMIRMREEKEMT